MKARPKLARLTEDCCSKPRGRQTGQILAKVPTSGHLVTLAHEAEAEAEAEDPERRVFLQENKTAAFPGSPFAYRSERGAKASRSLATRTVIPAKAGISDAHPDRDPRLRGGDRQTRSENPFRMRETPLMCGGGRGMALSARVSTRLSCWSGSDGKPPSLFSSTVIPAQAGISDAHLSRGPRLRGGDKPKRPENPCPRGSPRKREGDAAAGYGALRGVCHA